MANDSRQAGRTFKWYAVTVLPLAIGILIVVSVLVWNARFTVASGQKIDDLGYYSYGYKIEQYYARNSFRLTFWSSRGMEFVYDHGSATIDEVVEQSWIKEDAAIYLNLQIKYHDSVIEVLPARVIYDFHKGEIHVTSNSSLWRHFDNRHTSEDWMSDAEFDDVLSRLDARKKYPAVWFAAINDPNKPVWEILPQEAKAGEVILSKRNELGILSNFAATPIELYGKRYTSVEGFWQMMLYPEGTSDERQVTRGKDGKAVVWKYTREQVAQVTAFEAKSAGTLAEENMKTLGIDWVTFGGKRFPYRSSTPGEHYKLILAAMRAKDDQNPEVKRILLATGDLILKPDHHGEENPPPQWKYYDLWMQIRKELQTAMQKPAS